jgi:hypothetical protein
VSVIYLVVPFSFSEYIELLHCVHVTAFGCEKNGGHDGFNGAK